METKLQCISCGKDFISITHYKQKYCSHDCRYNYKNNPNWKGGLVYGKCLVCGNQTAVKISHFKKGCGKFCSLKCSRKYYGKLITENRDKNRIKKNCIVCAKDIYVKPSHINREGIYCSKECRNVDYKSRFTGEDNPNFKDCGYSGGKNSPIRRQRLKTSKEIKDHTELDWDLLKKQYNYSCACCKKKEPKIKLTKDHIIPITKNGHNGIDNIQPLCLRCNCKKHNKIKKYTHQLIIVF